MLHEAEPPAAGAASSPDADKVYRNYLASWSWTAFAASALILVGCAATPDNPAANAEAAEPLLCHGKDQCELYWQRAQLFVANNSAYRIRMANDTLIETYGPFGAKVDLAYRITKVPEGDGARIMINTGCDNFIRCYPTKTDAIIAFKRFVKPGGSIDSSNVGKSTATPQASTKYAYAAEQFAKATGCESPTSTLNFASAGAETFGVTCVKGEPMIIRCEFGQCRVLK